MGVERIDLRGVNAYLVDGVTLVDAGWPWSASAVRRRVEDSGGIDGVERVLITHYDLDHVGGLARLADEGLDATVYAAEPDASFLTGDAKPPLGNRKGAFQRLVGPGVRAPSLRVERVEGGDTVGGYKVVETPGHTPGHVAYLDGGRAFVGDAVRENGGALEPLPSLMSYGSHEARESVRALAERVEGGATAYVGHGTPVDNARGALHEASQV